MSSSDASIVQLRGERLSDLMKLLLRTLERMGPEGMRLSFPYVSTSLSDPPPEPLEVSYHSVRAWLQEKRAEVQDMEPIGNDEVDNLRLSFLNRIAEEQECLNQMKERAWVEAVIRKRGTGLATSGPHFVVMGAFANLWYNSQAYRAPIRRTCGQFEKASAIFHTCCAINGSHPLRAGRRVTIIHRARVRHLATCHRRRNRTLHHV